MKSDVNEVRRHMLRRKRSGKFVNAKGCPRLLQDLKRFFFKPARIPELKGIPKFPGQDF
jgi:hypothetical protein